MPIQHMNRRGEVYHLQARERRSGAIGYSFSRKPAGQPVERLPEGYEIYEEPGDAQVFLRKIKPTPILPSEKQLVESAVRKAAGLEHFIVAVEGNGLVVYTPDTDPDELIRAMADFSPMSAEQIRHGREYIIRHARYSKMMRFSLTDATNRLFIVERWCFLGSIDDWHYLSGGKPLAELVDNMCRTWAATRASSSSCERAAVRPTYRPGHSTRRTSGLTNQEMTSWAP